MSDTTLFSIANKLYPNRDLWTLTKEERAIVMETYRDYN